MSDHPFTFDPILLEKPKRLTPPYSWVGHIPFAFFLVKHHQPALIVEIGTTSGDSYFAFCQAVHDQQLNTKCFAIHTGLLNPHTKTREEVAFEEALLYNEEHYSSFSSILQKTAEDALPAFDDNSIDILHFVNGHDYESTLQYFKSWLPKMSKRGVILFHNTHETQNDFGVWVLWKELAGSYPSIDFPHSHGLGVSLFGRELRKGKAPFYRHFKLQPHLIDLLHRLTSSYIPREKVNPGPMLSASLFLPNAEGNYTEENRLTHSIDWQTKSLRFTLPEKLHAKSLRFHPSPEPCMIRIEQIGLEMEDDHQFPLSIDHISVPEDTKVNGSTFLFPAEQPTMFFDLKVPFDPKSITINLSVISLGDTAVSKIKDILLDLESSRSALASDIQELQKDKMQLLEEKKQLEQERTTAQEESNRQIQENERFRKAKEATDQKLNDLETEHQELLLQKKELEKLILKSEKQVEKIQLQKDELQLNLKKEQIELNAALQKVEKSIELQKLLENHVNQLKAQNQELSVSFDNIQNIYQKQIDTLEESITHNREELNMLQKRIILKEKEKKEEAERAYTLHKENLQLEKDISNLKNSFSMRLALGLTLPFRKINEWFGHSDSIKRLPPPVKRTPPIPPFSFWARQCQQTVTILAVGPKTKEPIQINLQQPEETLSFEKLIFPQLQEQVFFLDYPPVESNNDVSGSISMGQQTQDWGPVAIGKVDHPLVAHCESAKVFQNGGLHIVGWVVSIYPITQIDLWSGDRQIQPIALNQLRNDVQEDFPDYPDWQANGFDAQIQLPPETNTDQLTLRFVRCTGDTHLITLKPIQTNRELVIND